MTAFLASAQASAQAAAAWLLPLVGEPGPEPEDVKAGWVAFGIWLGMAAAVVLLSFSMVKRLRNARASEDAGRYGSDPVPVTGGDAPGPTAERAEPGNDDASGGSDGGGGGGD